jgi:hypothetical protein
MRGGHGRRGYGWRDDCRLIRSLPDHRQKSTRWPRPVPRRRATCCHRRDAHLRSAGRQVGDFGVWEPHAVGIGAGMDRRPLGLCVNLDEWGIHMEDHLGRCVDGGRVSPHLRASSGECLGRGSTQIWDDLVEGPPQLLMRTDCARIPARS